MAKATTPETVAIAIIPANPWPPVNGKANGLLLVMVVSVAVGAVLAVTAPVRFAAVFGAGS